MKDDQQRTEPIRHAAQQLDPFLTKDRLQRFSFFSANLTNFLPLMAPHRHGPLFREAWMNQQLCALDQRYFDRELPVPVVGWDSGLTSRLREHPGLVCTLHAGSYRLLSYLMAKERIPFAVLLSAETCRQQGPGFRQLFRQLHSGSGLCELPMIDAEQPGAIWRSLHLLKKGYNLLVYLDGDTGMPADRKRKLLRIPFLAQHLYVRKGVTFLAGKGKLPLYPICTFRRADGSLQVVADDPITAGDLPPQVFAPLALSRIFSFFGSHVVHFPAQWENWFCLHRQLDHSGLLYPDIPPSPELPDSSRVLPDPLAYGLYYHGSRHFLLEKWGYRSYPVTGDLYALLWNYWQSTVDIFWPAQSL